MLNAPLFNSSSETSSSAKRNPFQASSAGNESVPAREEDGGTSDKDSGRFYKKKKSAKRIRFEESSDEEENETADPLPFLVSNCHKKKKQNIEFSFQKDQNKPVQRRRRWTEEEKTAVRMGVEEYGVGKWVQIKRQYDHVLANRTPVQIKDCWRTMNK